MNSISLGRVALTRNMDRAIPTYPLKLMSSRYDNAFYRLQCSIVNTWKSDQDYKCFGKVLNMLDFPWLFIKIDLKTHRNLFTKNLSLDFQYCPVTGKALHIVSLQVILWNIKNQNKYSEINKFIEAENHFCFVYKINVPVNTWKNKTYIKYHAWKHTTL